MGDIGVQSLVVNEVDDMEKKAFNASAAITKGLFVGLLRIVGSDGKAGGSPSRREREQVKAFWEDGKKKSAIQDVDEALSGYLKSLLEDKSIPYATHEIQVTDENGETSLRTTFFYHAEDTDVVEPLVNAAIAEMMADHPETRGAVQEPTVEKDIDEEAAKDATLRAFDDGEELKKDVKDNSLENLVDTPDKTNLAPEERSALSAVRSELDQIKDKKGKGIDYAASVKEIDGSSYLCVMSSQKDRGFVKKAMEAVSVRLKRGMEKGSKIKELAHKKEEVKWIDKERAREKVKIKTNDLGR